MSTPNETRVSVKKLDAKKQIVYGEVYVPYVPDSQGDFMTPEEIERVAHSFLKKGAVEAIDTEHNLIRNGSSVVESFVARDGDPEFAAGAWVLGVHIPDRATWAKAEAGEIGGFSMYGTGRRQQRIVEIEVPDDGVLFGKTAQTQGNGAHDHVYALDFDAKGNFLGGETDEQNGHTHLIRKGTVTEPGPDGHRHRFSFVDTLAKGCGPLSEEQKGWQKKRKALRKGDFPGHPFRGNQYVDGDENAGSQEVAARISVNAPGGTEWDSGYDAAGSRDAVYAANVGVYTGRAMADIESDAALDREEENRRGYVEGLRRQHPDLHAITLDRYNTLWSAFHQLPEGGGGGGPERGSMKRVVEKLVSSVPVGKPFVVIVNGKSKGVQIRKSDMAAADMPEPVPEQDEERCDDCKTSKACKKAGHCLISHEKGEGAAECETCGK